MSKRIDYTKAITYTGQKLPANTMISFKIDGCRVLYRDEKFMSRNSKPYPGLEKGLTRLAKAKIKKYGDCEIFYKSFKKTSGMLQRHNPERYFFCSYDIYSLVDLDPRLIYQYLDHPTKEDLDIALRRAVEMGYEGIVIRTPDGRWYKHKPIATADVRITGFFEQHDKYDIPKGILGGFETKYGNVTAFKDVDRKRLWSNPARHIGKMIQVQYRDRYPGGKFRFAVKYLGFRYDKDEESFDTKAPEA